MKSILVVVLFVSMALTCPQRAFCESVDDMMEQFGREYESLAPPSESSSVSSDYKIGQTALATFYSARMLTLTYKQNQSLFSKYNEIIRQNNEIIRQNEEIIKILSALEKRGREKL